MWSSLGRALSRARRKHLDPQHKWSSLHPRPQLTSPAATHLSSVPPYELNETDEDEGPLPPGFEGYDRSTIQIEGKDCPNQQKAHCTPEDSKAKGWRESLAPGFEPSRRVHALRFKGYSGPQKFRQENAESSDRGARSSRQLRSSKSEARWRDMWEPPSQATGDSKDGKKRSKHQPDSGDLFPSDSNGFSKKKEPKPEARRPKWQPHPDGWGKEPPSRPLLEESAHVSGQSLKQNVFGLDPQSALDREAFLRREREKMLKDQRKNRRGGPLPDDGICRGVIPGLSQGLFTNVPPSLEARVLGKQLLPRDKPKLDYAAHKNYKNEKAIDKRVRKERMPLYSIQREEGDPWRPKKKVTREAMAMIRYLYREHPE